MRLSASLASLKQSVARTLALRAAESLLAGSQLRFQCLERAQVLGEAALYSLESSATGAGRAARRLEMEQLSSLCERRTGDSGN